MSSNGCVAAGALLHYCLVSTFCWMLCEGYQLYLDFVVVVAVESRMWRMLAFAMLVPAITVVGDFVRSFVRLLFVPSFFCW
jgi:hypothetical protein